MVMMSTTLTTNSQTQIVPLGQLLLNAQQWTFQGVLNLMAERGHDALTVAQLLFLANLDCGVTHASLVARRMGVSRQAVYRTTRELQSLDVLTLECDDQRRNQKIIRMTPHGLKVVSAALECLATLEASIRERIGQRDFDQLTRILRRDWGPVIGQET
jgi:DNA-binding MarR family transcriptional regulator